MPIYIARISTSKIVKGQPMTLRDQGIVASTDDQAMSLAQQACMPDEELYILLAPNSYQLYKSPDAS